MQPDILIISLRGDLHAHATRWALARQGVDTDFFVPSDFPQRSQGTAHGLGTFRLKGPQLRGERYSTIWNRRSPDVQLDERLHKIDRELAAQTGRLFLRCFYDFHSSSAWVNEPDAAERLERKVPQLLFASQAGFRVPLTIVSNDLAEIRSFVGQGPPCVVKSTRPMSWALDDQHVVLSTRRIEVEDLDDAVAVESCPLIYQHEVSKELEYRVVVFGSDVVCFEIDSQAVAGAELDWRVVDIGTLPIRQVACPEELLSPLQKFMRLSGAVHGSFDFIRGIDGELYFLEVNQQGQFLWLETFAPESRLLDRMAHFLLSGGARSFRYHPEPDPALFAEYYDMGGLQEDLALADELHVQADYSTGIDERTRA